MKLHFSLMLCLLAMSILKGQTLTGKELLSKSIEYHDPDGNWSTFSGQLHFTQVLVTKEKRQNKVTIQNDKDCFIHEQQREGHIVVRTFKQGKCSATLDGRTDFSAADSKKFLLSCEHIKRYRNYYIYLYGLPMKLKDEGAIIQKKVEKTEFQGKEYYLLKVGYDPNVGRDMWYFYINPKTYAMEGYRFYRTNANGIVKQSGEYITLEGIVEYKGIKIPKTRKWYMNKDDKFLATDILEKVTK